MDDTDPMQSQIETSVLTRTLIIAGFTVTGATRLPRQIEIRCERKDSFGATIPYLITLTEEEELTPEEVESTREAALAQGRVLVMIAATGGSECLSWEEALEMLGGAVPSWRALGNDYGTTMLALAKNQLPNGQTGEAWRLFELAVADGLEFLFGRRVRRMGGSRRGQRVSDMLAQAFEDTLLVVDCKASKEPFSVSMADLRPLAEYVRSQITRQRGQVTVSAALLVADSFAQDEERLVEVSGEFLAEVRVALVCLQAKTLVQMVSALSERPTHRTAINWRRVFCIPGLVHLKNFTQEADAADRERFPRSPVDNHR